MREFKRCHPLVNAVYFLAVIGFSMFYMHPVYLGISLVSSLSCAFMTGRGKTLKSLGYLFLCALFAAALSPLFSHAGVTVLCYLPSGNPLTLESILYGAASGVMFFSVMGWFFCFHRVMTGDKWMYLFGKVMPVFSLMLSMTLRFVPKYQRELTAISHAQKGIGADAANKGMLQKAKSGMHMLSILVTRCFEDSVDTADSMKSRGYGLPGRTAFSNFLFTKRDRTILLLLLILSLAVLICGVTRGAYFRYFPSIKGAAVSAKSLCGMIAYLMLSLTPVMIEGREAVRWKKLRSRI